MNKNNIYFLLVIMVILTVIVWVVALSPLPFIVLNYLGIASAILCTIFTVKTIKFILKMKTHYRCPICHGTNIQVRAWVDANTNEYITDCDDGEGWCEDCETEIMLEENGK